MQASFMVSAATQTDSWSFSYWSFLACDPHIAQIIRKQRGSNKVRYWLYFRHQVKSGIIAGKEFQNKYDYSCHPKIWAFYSFLKKPFIDTLPQYLPL